MVFWSGSQAVVEGALKKGARFFAGYPITPATPIMEKWAQKAAGDQRLKFLQAEDEIAALHLVTGAAVAGLPSFTATSGPGFSLMVEGLSLGFVWEAPVVLIQVQRSGPSTGLPTRAAQGEILQTRFGPHGDVLFPVFYPTSVEEIYFYTQVCFHLAWRFKTPTILLLDAYLSLMKETFEPSRFKFGGKIKVNNKTLIKKTGLINRVEVGRKIEKIKKGMEEFAAKTNPWHLWGDPKTSVLLVATGFLARALCCFANEWSVFVPLQIWPPLEKEIKKVAKTKEKILVVEANEGQLGLVIASILGPQRVEVVSWREEVVDLEKLKSLIVKRLK